MVFLMKLTDKFKDKIDSANTFDEMKDIIAQAVAELSDDDLEDVTGGKMDDALFEYAIGEVERKFYYGVRRYKTMMNYIDDLYEMKRDGGKEYSKEDIDIWLNHIPY